MDPKPPAVSQLARFNVVNLHISNNFTRLGHIKVQTYYINKLTSNLISVNTKPKQKDNCFFVRATDKKT